MANTYSRMRVHLIFVVKYRASVIKRDWEGDLFRYLNVVSQNFGCKLLEVNGVEDHVHLLISYNPDTKVSDIARTLKSNSSRWINDNNFCREVFRWQPGYAAFSASSRNCTALRKYISNQKKHHKKKVFREEYLKLLSENDLDYDEKYLFSDLE